MGLMQHEAQDAARLWGGDLESASDWHLERKRTSMNAACTTACVLLCCSQRPKQQAVLTVTKGWAHHHTLEPVHCVLLHDSK